MGVSKSDHSWQSLPCSSEDAALVAASFRDDARRAVATLARALHDLDRAEDAVQEAYFVALECWPHDRIPANPSRARR